MCQPIDYDKKWNKHQQQEINKFQDYLSDKLPKFQTLNKDDYNKKTKMDFIKSALELAFEEYRISFMLLEDPKDTKNNIIICYHTLANEIRYDFFNIDIYNPYGNVVKLFDDVCDYIFENIDSVRQNEDKEQILDEILAVYINQVILSL